MLYIYIIYNTYRYRIEVDKKVEHSINCIDSSFHLCYFCAHKPEDIKINFKQANVQYHILISQTDNFDLKKFYSFFYYFGL